jgi:2'-5' RNA ligase
LRLFFALWPDARTRARIAEVAADLRLDGDARSVAAENFHLTLAFVGEISDSKLAVVRQIGCDLRSAACEITLTLHPGDLLRYRPPATLRAHVTLARKVSQTPVPQAMSPFAWSARSFSLVRSDSSGARSVYTVLDTWPLLDEMGKL